MARYTRSFVIVAKNLIDDSVRKFPNYTVASEQLGIGIKWLKKQLRTNVETTFRAADNSLWSISIQMNTACKLVPCFEGDVPTQYCPSYTSAINLLNVSRRTFYKHFDSVPLGETFTIKDCFKREWMCVCYQEKQTSPFGNKATKK